MKYEFENGLFIFRRDLRIIDNHGLELIHSKCKNIYTIFIFTPEQVSNKNKYKSDNAIQFMLESLHDLDQTISNKGGKLSFFYGENKKIISFLIDELNINYIGYNKDYTPYALERDNQIKEICADKNIILEESPDYYLHEPNTIFSASGQPYKKFTPYYETCLHKKIMKPSSFQNINHFKKIYKKGSNSLTIENAFTLFLKNKLNNDLVENGGRKNALKQLLISKKSQKHYDKTRNILTYPSSQLSAFIKFGCISIREVYMTFHLNHEFVRQLIWRDFYANILFNFPYVLDKPMKSSLEKIHWSNNEKNLKAWENGETGFPIVDAGMRQLNKTGFMHNRSRLIVASFLVKTLLINWKLGEKYFSNKLYDYDVASNNGNWQWIAGTGSDSTPYFRIMNPWLQSKDFDPDAIYIKTWIPELEMVPPKSIHEWYKDYELYKNISYPKPMVSFEVQKEKALQMYRKVYH